MALISGNSTTVNFFTFHLILLLAVATNVSAVSVQELESMLTAVRARGYNLFANAISTSDIHYEVISGNAFTLFAPINSSLFALDMTTTASDYVTTLRCHVVTRWLSLDDLQKLPARSSIPTLLKDREAVIERSTAFGEISVDGIRVAVPGLFYGRDLAVHGLGGIISSRYPVGFRQRSSPPMIHPPPSFGGKPFSNHAPPPPARSSMTMSNPPQNFTGNHTGSPPPARSSPMSHPPHNFTGTHSSVPPPPVRPSPMINLPPDFTGIHPPPPVRPSSMINLPPDFTGIHNSSNMSPPPAIFPGNGCWMNNNTAASGPISTEFPPEISPSIDQSSAGDTKPKPNDGARALQSELSSPITYESFAGEFSYSYTSEWMAYSQPLDENTFDCPLTDGETGADDHGYLYTRQRYNVPKMTCHQTYQDTL